MRLVTDTETAQRRADFAEIQRALALMTEGVFEVRIPKAGRHKTVRGYFNDPAAAAKAVLAWSGSVPAVYITLNPVNPALLARASNRLETYAESTTSDVDIESRRWLLVDCDPKRPGGISSSNPEHAAALAKTHEIATWLHEQGWPEPIVADSGNGGHLLYRIALSNDLENTQVVQRCLQALAALFDSAAVGVDAGVFNASRISKLYGTYACKGDNTPDRPHRLSRILSAPTTLDFVGLDLLEELAGLVPKPEPRRPAQVHRGTDFFASTNQNAMERLDQWVPRLFPDAKPYRSGYRVASHNLKRDREEDLGIQPEGIKDFGVHDAGDPKGGKRTPIDLVLEWGAVQDAKEAALWLCDQMGLSPDQLGWKKHRETNSGTTPLDRDYPPLSSYEEDLNVGARLAKKPEEKPKANEFIALADFISGPPKSSYLIKNVIPAKGLGQVFGSSNVGKSFLLIDMAMHLASGREWRGFKTKKICVLYIAAEGLSGLAGRMKAWTQRYGIVPDLLFIRPYSVQLTVTGAAAALAEKIQGLPQVPELIILDTLAANFGPGNENDAEDMAIAMEGLRSLAGEWFALCAHHSGHADKTRSRGHSSLYAALDMEIQVNRPDPLGPIEVTHTKCRDMQRMDPLFFNLETESLPWADEDGEPINSAVLVPAGRPDAYEEGGRESAPLGGKQALALQLLKDMYSTHAANTPGGVARVLMRDWYEAMDFEPDRSNRSKIRSALERRKFIRQENSYVYLC